MQHDLGNYSPVNLGASIAHDANKLAREAAVLAAATKLSATPSDFGLWYVLGRGELTQGQLLDLAGQR